MPGKGEKVKARRIDGLPVPGWAEAFASAYDALIGDDVGDLEVLVALSDAAREAGIVVAGQVDIDLGGALDGDPNFNWPGVYLAYPERPGKRIAIATDFEVVVARDLPDGVAL